MGNAISSALTDSWLASHDSRVKKWLDDATEDSVIEALTSSFFPGRKGEGGLPAARAAQSLVKETFGAYGSLDAIDNRRYWREKDLGGCLSDRFPGSELNASIPILWRCFHFHAYFPFPQKPERLDYPAFQRAIALLAAGGNLRLGDNADGITIDVDRYPNANARAEKQLWIMFKSLSIRIPQPTESESIETSEANLSTTEEDLMDVLCLAQPHDPCIMPAPIEELRPHAKRILNSSRPYACSSIPRGDFLTLIKLLLSTQMNKPVRFSQVHTARTFPTLAIDLLDGLANSVVDRFSSNENGEIDWHGFNNVMSTYLPGFSFKFHILFTNFLFPSTSTNQPLDVSLPTSALPGAYAQYLALFLHPPMADANNTHEASSRLEALFTLQSIQTIYSATPITFSSTELVAAISSIKTGTLLLVTGDAVKRDSASAHHPHHTPARVTFGACIPTPWDLQGQHQYKANPAQVFPNYTSDHVLFQLEPKMELLLPETDAWITDLISIIDSDSETGKKGGIRFGSEDQSGLSMDFDTGIATLKNVIPANENDSEDAEKQEKQNRNQTEGCAYQDITAAGEGNTELADEWETRMRIQKLEVYDLRCSAAKPFDEKATVVPRKPRFRPKAVKPLVNKASEGVVLAPSEPQVGREELRKRIEGFGSGA